VDPEMALPTRTAAFGQGAGFSSLAQDSARQNSQVPHTFTPTSVLHQLYLSPENGNSPKDAQRKLLGGGNYLPTGNSMSPETTQAARYLSSKYASV
jgi:hypothetical protein